MFFLSTALYPLWKMAESSELLAAIVAANPFTYGVELIRFALYGKFAPEALLWTALAFVAFGAGAVWGYDPARGLIRRRAR